MAASPEPESESALDWLYRTQMFGIKLGLDNVHRLLSAMELPGQRMKFIHVAGTNGKGSTCAFAHAMLNAAGINAGLFTSPHLIRFNERIRDCRGMISNQEVEARLSRIRDLIRDWQPHPTFFEIAFVLALDWFRSRDVEWIVLETGMGGRLDATNAIVPAASVITSIGLDHTEFLGETLAQIAAEKGGIIKRGVPVITQNQDPLVMEVLRRQAALRAASLVVAPAWSASAVGLAGAHQKQNAGLAVAALEAAGLAISGDQVQEGLRNVTWPGRFQQVGEVILDGAHNPDSVRALVETWQTQFPGRKAVVTFGAVSSKDIPAMLHLLAPIVLEWQFVGFQSPRAVPPADLLQAWTKLDLPASQAQSYPTVAASLATPVAELRLITGSLFLIGEAGALLSDQIREFEAGYQ